jgi:hypothetical protein
MSSLGDTEVPDAALTCLGNFHALSDNDSGFADSMPIAVFGCPLLNLGLYERLSGISNK